MMEVFKPRHVKWDAQALLQGLTGPHFTASEELRKQVRRYIWGDMRAEYDAENLWKYICERRDLFNQFTLDALDQWRDDERNHYIGLRRICSLMYGISEKDIDQEMEARLPDFGSVAPFLRDEQNTLIVLAYDELVSARGYRLFFPSFERFGPDSTLQFVKWASRDEYLHYQNFLELAIALYPDRSAEALDMLDRIAEFESSENKTYQATFILDHTEETLSSDFLLDCMQHIRAQVEKGAPSLNPFGDTDGPG